MSERGQTVLDFAIGVSVFLVIVAFVLTFVPGMVQPFESSTQEQTAASDRLASQLATDMLVTDVTEPYLLDRGCAATFFALENSDGDDSNDLDAYDDNDGVVRSNLSDIKSSDLYEPSCGFDVGESVFTRLGVASGLLDVRVSLRADVDGDGSTGMLCIDADSTGGNDVPDRADRIIETDDPYASGTECDMTGDDTAQDDYDIAFETADEPPTDSRSVVAARRTVRVDGGLGDGSDTASLVVEVW